MTNLRELVFGIDIWFRSSGTVHINFTASLLDFFGTAVLSPETNPNLRKIGFHFNRYTGEPSSPEVNWWEAPEIHSHIADFEAHIIGLVHAFKLEGVWFECLDDLSVNPEPQIARVENLRQMIPQVFQNLAQQRLILHGDGSSSTQ